MTSHLPRLLLLTTLLVFGCKKEEAVEEIGYGTLNGNTYSNDYFGFSIDLPQGWHPLNREEINKTQAQGRELVAGNDKSMERALKAAELKTLTLFSVYERPLDPNPLAPFNPNISCIAEKVSHMPDVKTGRDYFRHAKKLMQASQVPYSFPAPIYSEQVGGTSFDVLPSVISLGPNKIYQKFYAAPKKEYIFSFILTYSTPEEEAELKKILTTVKLD